MRKELQGWVLACGLLAFGLSGSASAMNVGKPQIVSYLAQPLDVRLSFQPDPADTDLSLYQASLYELPDESSPQMGRGQIQSDLKVDLIGSAENGFWIRIHSARAVIEPVVSFVLEIRRPGSLLTRSLDLLIDPAPAGAYLPENQALLDDKSESFARLEDSANPGRLREAAFPSGVTQYYGPVRAGELLTHIAVRVRSGPQIPLDALEQAIFRLNPDAFAGGRDSLKAGVLLAIPDLPSIRAMGFLPELNDSERGATVVKSSKEMASRKGPPVQPFVAKKPVAKGKLALPARTYLQQNNFVLDMQLRAPGSYAQSSGLLSSAAFKAPALRSLKPDTGIQWPVVMAGGNASMASGTETLAPNPSRVLLLASLGLLLSMIGLWVFSGVRKRQLDSILLAHQNLINSIHAREEIDALLQEAPPPGEADAETEQELTRQLLQLRLTAALAEVSDDVTQQAARAALKHIERGEFTAAEAMVVDIEAKVLEHSRHLPDRGKAKVVSFSKHKQRYG